MEDQPLTDHFTLYQLTLTSHKQFQDENRDLTQEQLVKLQNVARLLEHVMFILDAPLTVTSAYRCKPLNDFIGSTDRSQHLLCEAVDFIPKEIDLGKSFRLLWQDIKVNGANTGQLIHENDDGKEWLHISLGEPYRPKEKCKQVLKYENKKYVRLA